MKITNLTYSNGVMFYTVNWRTERKSVKIPYIEDVLRIAKYHSCTDEIQIYHFRGYLGKDKHNYTKYFDVWTAQQLFEFRLNRKDI